MNLIWPIGGGPGNTDDKWEKDPKFSWWEILVIVGIVLTVGLLVVAMALG